MKTNTYLSFKDTAEAAMTFYSEVFGTPLEAMMRFGDIPGMEMPEPLRNRVAHVRMALGNNNLMASDSFEGPDSPPYAGMHGFNVQVSLDTPEEAHALFAKLADGGEITMEMQETFWAHAFGSCRDRFGTPWMINCDKPMG